MLLTSGAAALLAVAPAFASPIQKRQSCPNIHIFGARETTAPAGYGSAGTFVNLILNAYPGSTAEAVNYPAAGGTNAQYASSVQAGTQDVANQINNFNKQCPSTKLVLIGYSQVSLCSRLTLHMMRGLPLYREPRLRIMRFAEVATRIRVSLLPIHSSPPPQAMPSRLSSGQAIHVTHRLKHSIMAAAVQAA